MCRETRTTTPGTVQIKRMCGHTGVPAEAGTGQRPPVDRTQCPRHPREHTVVQSWHHEGSTLQDVSSTYFSGTCREGDTTGAVQEAPGLTGRYEAGSRGHERERGTPAVGPDRGSPLRMGTLQQQGHPHTVQKGHGLHRQGHPHTHCRKGMGSRHQTPPQCACSGWGHLQAGRGVTVYREPCRHSVRVAGLPMRIVWP